MNVMEFLLLNIGSGFALAMDAFSVSVTNGLTEPNMRRKKICLIAGIYAFFQFIMPFTGWVCVTTISRIFGIFEKYIPLIALVLLCYIGGKMLLDCIFPDKKKTDEDDTKCSALCMSTLLLQGVATSIDALSVGFTISKYDLTMALVACLIIGLVTFFICYAGVIIGKKAGTRLADKAGILGGVILITIGIKIFIG